ncbi:hypothetical protein BHE74_00038262 [Ensete ventricosum]|nr:hypothetical protein BHE74_00038262 [Ensete ventricosum]
MMERLHSGRGRGWKQRLCTVAKGHSDNAIVRGREDEGSNNGCCGKGEREEQRGSDVEMAAAGNGCCRGGLGCGCVATTRATARAASGGGGLHGCVEEEQRVMAAGATAGCSDRGEKEVEEAVIAVEVVGKRRRQ